MEKKITDQNLAINEIKNNQKIECIAAECMEKSNEMRKEIDILAKEKENKSDCCVATTCKM